MNTIKLGAFVSAAALCLSLTATANSRQGAAGSTWDNQEQLSDRDADSDWGRSADSPPEVMSPPNGYPGGAMSTTEHFALRKRSAKGGVGKTADNRSTSTRERAMGSTPYREWENGEDTIGSRSAAPESDNRSYGYFGSEIPFMRGLNQEMAINQLHHIHQSEIDLAKMAETRAKSEVVLNFAHRIRADHERMDKDLVAMANRRDINLERFQPSTNEKAVKSRLQKLNVPEFEAAFVNIMDRGHEDAVMKLRSSRRFVSDAGVRKLIDDALPVIAAHKTGHDMLNKNKSRAGDEGESM